jgi:hypothetical protein
MASDPALPAVRRAPAADVDWADEEVTQPGSTMRQKTRPKLSSISEEIVLVSEHDPRREE